jgi:hypothetical protein
MGALAAANPVTEFLRDELHGEKQQGKGGKAPFCQVSH